MIQMNAAIDQARSDRIWCALARRSGSQLERSDAGPNFGWTF